MTEEEKKVTPTTYVELSKKVIKAFQAELRRRRDLDGKWLTAFKVSYAVALINAANMILVDADVTEDELDGFLSAARKSFRRRRMERAKSLPNHPSPDPSKTPPSA